mmetsp:Transcript_32002/g.80580  ORF Transcript_32002/g.80580 Transcript_32002/m.80580 type:complete len:203 (-) Transcript_32002:1693-2301(-)
MYLCSFSRYDSLSCVIFCFRSRFSLLMSASFDALSLSSVSSSPARRLACLYLAVTSAISSSSFLTTALCSSMRSCISLRSPSDSSPLPCSNDASFLSASSRCSSYLILIVSSSSLARLTSCRCSSLAIDRLCIFSLAAFRSASACPARSSSCWFILRRDSRWLLECSRSRIRAFLALTRLRSSTDSSSHLAFSASRSLSTLV